jgi:hypothetical protein
MLANQPFDFWNFRKIPVCQKVSHLFQGHWLKCRRLRERGDQRDEKNAKADRP